MNKVKFPPNPILYCADRSLLTFSIDKTKDYIMKYGAIRKFSHCNQVSLGK